MALGIKIEISGITEVIRDYDKFRFDMQNNMVVPLDTSSMKYLKVIHTNFDSQGVTFNQKWPPLHKRTIAEKKRLGFSSKPLVRTGALRRGFGRVVRKTSNDSYIYNTQEYAMIHQEGTDRVPKRILVDIDDERIKMVEKIFTDWLQKIVNKNNL